VINKVRNKIKQAWDWFKAKTRKPVMIILWTIFVVSATVSFMEGKELLEKGLTIQVPAVSANHN